LLLLAAARLRGARVVLAGRGHERLELARRWGADIVLDAAETGEGEAQVHAIREQANDGRGADVVFEAVGLPETWQVAVECTRPGGVTDLFGGCPGGSTAMFDTFGIHYEERTLKGTFHHTPRHFAAAVDAIASGAVRAGELITAQMPLSGLLDAFAALDRGEGIKFAFRPAAAASGSSGTAGKLL
jgi:L-iditol 2-dehydrogenase